MPPGEAAPSSLAEFNCRPEITTVLRALMDTARAEGAPLPHLLICGPKGSGRAALAKIVADELGVAIWNKNALWFPKRGDLAAVITNLEANDILLINDIHELHPDTWELVSDAVEIQQLKLVIGEGPSARKVSIDLPPFTLIGTTDRPERMPQRVEQRIGLQMWLQPASDSGPTGVTKPASETVREAASLDPGPNELASSEPEPARFTGAERQPSKFHVLKPGKED